LSKKITVVMPFLNEKRETLRTIESICKTSNQSDVNIIAIDDHSDIIRKLPNLNNLTVMRNHKRIGVDASRQLGVESSQTDRILVIDAHMRFRPGWVEEMTSCIDKAPETLWCCICLALGHGSGEIDVHKGKYFGADMVFVNKDAKKDRPARDCIEPKWADERKDEEYPIPCILGANYFFSKRWFEYIGGLRGLKSWGTSEPFLSIKSYLAGGDCRITKKIEIGHIFRDNAPYATNVCDLVYNKILLCKTLLPDEVGSKLMGYLPKDRSWRIAQRMVKRNAENIEKLKAHSDSVRTSSIHAYCQRFDIRLP